MAAALAAAAPAADRPAGGWRPLFDGKSLDGWTPKITGQALGADPLGTFIVDRGTIRVSYAHYGKFAGRFGHLAYRLPQSAYRLRFEYRFDGTYLPDVEAWQHSNSGIMFHGQAPETITRDQQFPVSLEFQLNGADGREPRPTGNLCTPGTNVVIGGKLETEHCIRSRARTFPNGRWIKAELEVTPDGRITHRIEGVPVLTYSAAQLDPADAEARPLIDRAGGTLAISGGYLYLQSEGHPVAFRKIELLPLN
ncbi:DUF1080 domain-containing protein [Sphingosinicella sp. BN140058]|uniref:3-keto-disaccharide hydrolase n=1 Tax=Sphingosinicella sp. BN140058 TaxID=1892855 RepID=UPI00197EC4AD|nr:DUF1080 domain-containing protein [Sphingosinicella sp. BN140058]